MRLRGRKKIMKTYKAALLPLLSISTIQRKLLTLINQKHSSARPNIAMESVLEATQMASSQSPSVVALWDLDKPTTETIPEAEFLVAESLAAAYKNGSEVRLNTRMRDSFGCTFTEVLAERPRR